MNSISIKKTISSTNKKIQALKEEGERINAELKKLEEKNKTLTSLLKRQEALDREYESLAEVKAPKEKNAATDPADPTATTE